MPRVTDATAAVDEAADLILSKFDYWLPYTDPFRFALAVGQRASFRDVVRTAPVLDIGVNDGSTARILHHGKSRIAWGGDMPEENTLESQGLFVPPDFGIYDNLIGMDACDIPFPDNSFNTVVSTEVFFYGMDRAKLLSEIVRVLAPGGTLAFSESSPEILGFPAIATALKKDIPAFNVPDEPKDYYQRTLGALGMQDFFFRPYLDKSVAALTLYMNYAWPPDSNRYAYAQLVQTDPRYRELHREALETIRTLMKKEFTTATGPDAGWNVFVACRKPGELSERPSPTPCCLFCRSTDLDRSFQRCSCRSCGHVYQTRFGKAFILRDPERAYCPKPVGMANVWTSKVERRIDAALSSFYLEGATRIATSPGIVLVGVDPSTEFTVSHLQQNGIQVDAVCSENERHVGERIGNIRIIGLSNLGAVQAPILLSGYSPKLSGRLLRSIMSAGYRGRIFAIGNQVQELSTASPAVFGKLLLESAKSRLRRMPRLHRALVQARRTMGPT